MADKIKLLSEIVANQIAAGEVVNRPSSVVKEMVENAIDAGATSVKVNFRDGGKDLIHIVDNGCGMSPMDARMAFDRHATSKISSVDDIYALNTFGFRGEALASIAAVAQIELKTRQEGDEFGGVTEVNGGEFVGQKPTMCPVGSQFFVRNLFYNVPARRRFLEKTTTSTTHIKSEFQRVALCYPKIHFELYSNDAPLYNLQPKTLAGRIVDVIGKHIKQNLLEVSADTSIAKVSGYIGRPAAAKKRNSEQYLFVNGRYFSSQHLNKAIFKSYEKLIPSNCFPSYFLYLTVEPDRVDVNVHPQKTEVKFADEEAVWQIIHAAVRETLAKTGAVPMMDFDDEGIVDIPTLTKGVVYNEPSAVSNSGYNPFEKEYANVPSIIPNMEFGDFNRSNNYVPTIEGEDGERLYSSAIGEDGNSFSSMISEGGGNSYSSAIGEDNDNSFSSMIGGDDDNSFSTAIGGDDDNSFSSMIGGGDDNSFSSAIGEDDGPSYGSVMGIDDDFRELESIDSGDIKLQNRDFHNSSTESNLDFENSELDFISSADESVEQLSLIESGLVPTFSKATSIGSGYITALMDNRLVVIDLRRVKERIVFDNFMSMLGNGSAVSQQLLFTERLLLSTEEYTLMEDNAVDFASLGFDIEYLGEGSIELKGTPADMPTNRVDELIYDLLRTFEMPIDMETVHRERVALVMAKNGSRVAPKIVDISQIEQLLQQLVDSSNYSFSPSGKAIIAEITIDDIRAKLN